MKRLQIQSTNIKGIGFEDGTLEVEFKQGAVYQYSPITEDQFRALLESDSKSKWINENIKSKSTIKFKKV